MKFAWNKIASILIALSFPLFLVAVYFGRTQAAGSFAGGNIVDAKNITKGDTLYHEPITAEENDTIRFRIQVINLGDQDITNASVFFNLSNPTSPTATVTGSGVSPQTDSVNLTPSGASLDFVEGSGLKYGPVCPAGCSISDNIAAAGVSLGNVSPGDANSYQISIEAKVVGQPTTVNKPKFRAGNIFDGGNRTDRVVNWQDPIAADPGEIVEFRVQVINESTVTARNTIVRVELPQTDSTGVAARVFISASDADTVNDTATVNVSGNVGQRLVYLPGHAIKWGPGCASGCALPDNIYVEGISLGDVQPGDASSYQVTFKATVSNQVAPSPSPTPAPTAGPTSSCVSLSVSPSDGVAPLLVRFTGNGFDSAGSIQLFEFNFGDASGGQPQVWQQTGSDAAHRYENTGTFTASLKVKDSRGNWLESNDCRKTIVVRSAPVVLAAAQPAKKLPETGLPTLLGVATFAVGPLGLYLYRRFKLV